MEVSLLRAKGTSPRHVDTGSLGDSEVGRAAQWGPCAPARLCLAALGSSISSPCGAVRPPFWFMMPV